MALISIITIVKDHPAGLRWTAKSIDIQQEVGADTLEWIVVNGGASSIDPVLIEYRTLNPLVIAEPDRGIFDALNKGIDNATGDYLWFLHAGDCLSDAFVLRDVQRELLATGLPQFLYGDARDIDGIKVAKSIHMLKYGMHASHQAMLYQRKALGDLRYDIGYKIAGDYDFTLRFVLNSDRHVWMDRVLVDCEAYGLSVTHAQKGRIENYRIRDKIGHMNLWQNQYVFAKDRLKWYLKTKMPFLYRFLRRRNSRPANSKIRVTQRSDILGGRRQNRP